MADGMIHFMGDAGAPLHWLWAGRSKRLSWRRYWIRDVLQGLNAVLVHYLFKLGPIGACSAAGGALVVSMPPAPAA